MRGKKIIRIASMFLVALLASRAPRASAQLAVSTATLSGTVTDPSGAVIRGAQVTLASAQNGVQRAFTTDAGGRYDFNQLPPAIYQLNIKAQGFESYQQGGIALDAGQSATQNVALTVGSAATSVTVYAQASQLNTDNSNIAASLDAKQIVELPLNVRNVYGLITLNSSVNNTSEGQMLLGGGGNSTDNADQDISFLNFAGGFFGTSAFMLDGAWDTDPEWGAVIYVPSVDAVQEFKIQNNSFTAQYGWSTGNVVDVVTKSGTNAFHGSAYWFYTNQNFNANQWFSDHDDTAKPKLDRNQAGFSAGGPLYIPGIYQQREKTFIYGLFEHLGLSTPTVTTYTVPDSNFRAGNFSEILGGPSGQVDALGRSILVGQIYDPRSARPITAGQVDPVTGLMATQTGYIRDPIPGNNLNNLAGYIPDPVGSKLMSYYPTPTSGGVSNNLVVSAPSPANSNEYLIRVDHNFNERSRAYFRYSYKKEMKTGIADTWGASNPAGPGNVRPNNRWGMWAGYSQVFNPTFTMNIAAGVEIWHETSNNQSFGFDPSTLGLPSYVATNSPLFPIVNVGGESSEGYTQGNQQALTNHGPIGSVSVDFIKLFGKHTLNFGVMGVEQEDSQHNYFETTLDFQGSFTSGPDPQNGSGFASGNGVAQMLLGVLDNGAAPDFATQVGTVYNPSVSNHLLGEYVQDDWRPNSKLTMNLGLRYEVQTPVTYRHDVASTFNPDALNPISYSTGTPVQGELQFLGPGNRYVYHPNYDNIAPRLGFSYKMLPNAVLHGGYGIFYPQSLTCCFPGESAGFSAFTQANTSLNGGINPNPNISTSNPWGGQYNQITGNSLGGYQQDGNSVSSTFISRRSPYVQQWMLGIQYDLTHNDNLEVDYVGNRGTRMITASQQYDQLNPSYLSMGTTALNALVANPFYGHITSSSCNLNNPTIQQAQLLVPYPQYCWSTGGVGETDAPVGFSDYNALQVNYNHRITRGLTALISYTYSKFLDNVEGNNNWSYNGNVAPANNYNLAAEKSVDGSDTPHSLVAHYVYQLPIGRGQAVGSGMGRIANAVLGGWELAGIASFKSGIPISISGNDISSYGGNPRPDVVGNVHVSHPNINEWFNTAAFAYAPYGTFGTAPRFFSTLRGPRYQDWDTSLDKNWNLPAGMRAQFRLETFNTFNHPSFYSPSGTSYGGCDPNAQASCKPGFGQITNTFPSRTVQIAGKFYW